MENAKNRKARRLSLLDVLNIPEEKTIIIANHIFLTLLCNLGILLVAQINYFFGGSIFKPFSQLFH